MDMDMNVLMDKYNFFLIIRRNQMKKKYVKNLLYQIHFKQNLIIKINLEKIFKDKF